MTMRTLLNKLLARVGYQVRAVHVPLQSFEQGMVSLARQIKIDAVVDVGVAQGTPSLYAAFSGASFLLIEANPRYTKEVEALGERLRAKVEMVFCGSQDGGSVELWDTGRSSSMYEHGSSHQKVPVETLDTLAKRNAITGPTLLKIDVEGAEMEVLAGAPSLLKSVQAIVIEVSWGRNSKGAQYMEVLNFMDSNGFTLHNIVEGGGILEHDRLVHADFIFLRK